MKTIGYWLTWERAPSLERLPLALLRATVSGMILGVPVGFVLLAIFAPHQVRALTHPLWWLLMMLVGVIFSVSFYVTCSLPQSYLTSFAVDWPAARLRWVRAALGAVGGMAGILLVSGLLQLLPMRIVTIGSIQQWLALEAVLGGALALLIGAWVQKDLREKQLNETAARAQAQALQAQIQPHFFFNTMNTVQSLIDTDAAEAKRVIGRLSGMFRYALAAGQAGTVTLAEELAFIHDYLRIEQVRFGERLRFTLPDAPPDFRLPSLALQPLVENAVRHGISRLIDGGEITLTITRDGDCWLLTVCNPCDRQPTLQPFPPGHALDNIQRRLHLLYGPRAALVLQWRDGIVEATMGIPCES